MKSLGITHIVCIRDAKEGFAVKPRFLGEFEYLVLDVVDSEEQNLIRLFPQAKQFINNAIAQGGTVLVHCNGGISLSPSFTIMYVMEQYNMSWEDALHLVQNRRYCISPNGGFLSQIKEYESIYKANNELSKHGGTQNRVVSTARRKRDEDDSDDEVEVESRRREAPVPKTLAVPGTTPIAQDIDMS